MKLFIKEIIVTDRIRKDLGSVQELAEDIKANGLINPIVVNEENVLLAGERRLEAVKLLGWTEVPVTVMQTRDKEHELNIEISENEIRKEFSRAERAKGMKRQLEVETAKAKIKMSEGGNTVGVGRLNSDTPLRADEATAKQFGIGKDTLRKELTISEHQDLLEPEDFADWDEGRLSTNKAYQKLKEKLKEAEEETDKVKRELTEEKVRSIKAKKQHEDEMADLERASRALAKGNSEHAAQLADQIEKLEAELEKARTKEPEVVEKIPDDYESLKASAKRTEQDYMALREKDLAKDKKIAELEAQLGRDKLLKDADRDVQSFTTYTLDYIRRYGGHVWAFEQLSNLSEPVRKNFIDSIKALNSFTAALIGNLGGNLNEQ